MSELAGEVFLNVQCFVQLAFIAKYLISGHWGLTSMPFVDRANC